MSNRPFLEKASWVAGIVSAGIALVVWISPTLNLGSTASPAGQQAPAPRPPQPTASSAAPQKPSSPALSSSSAPAQTRWTCEGVATDLSQAVAAAEAIGYIGRRDAALQDVARKSLCTQDFDLFRKVVGRIGYVGRRDDAFGDGVDFALGIRRFDLANEFAKEIGYVGRRDAARARIAAAASMR